MKHISQIDATVGFPAHVRERLAIEVAKIDAASRDRSPKMLTNVGESIADRIKDGGGIIEFNWQSLRGKLDGEG